KPLASDSVASPFGNASSLSLRSTYLCLLAQARLLRHSARSADRRLLTRRDSPATGATTAAPSPAPTRRCGPARPFGQSPHTGAICGPRASTTHGVPSKQRRLDL